MDESAGGLILSLMSSSSGFSVGFSVGLSVGTGDGVKSGGASPPTTLSSFLSVFLPAIPLYVSAPRLYLRIPLRIPDINFSLDSFGFRPRFAAIRRNLRQAGHPVFTAEMFCQKNGRYAMIGTGTLQQQHSNTGDGSVCTVSKDVEDD